MTTERRRMLVARVAFGLWALGTAFLIWVMLVFANQAQSTSYKDVPLELAPEESLAQLAQRLADNGVIAHPLAFQVYLRLMGAERQLRRGPIVVNRALTVREHLARLSRNFGPSHVRVLLPEGFTRFDAATRLARFGVASRDALLHAGSDPSLLSTLGIEADSVEGYLFPAVYSFPLDSKAATVVTRMVRVFRDRTRPHFDAYALAHDGAPFSLTPHQLLTLASIVEREARMPDERPVIAGVFLNRLKDPAFKPKRLQADPTAAYGCLVAGDRIPSCSSFDGKRVTPAMLRDEENPYSTYRRDGLPPGPICSPGLDSIKAALNPAAHDYFYFVTKGGGRHAFSHSLTDHNLRIKESPAP